MSGPLARLPGWGIAKGMLFSLVRFFQPKVTVQYPEQVQEISPKHRGRLILLYDEAGNLKCETCFQCAMACPIEIIDMGGVDTKNRYHVHWGPAEQYAERREESALRRSGRPVPDRSFRPWAPIDVGALETILVEEDYDPRRMLRILERTQAAYGHLPVAAIQHISHATGAWYSEIYGIASSYPHLVFESGRVAEIGICRCSTCLTLGGGRVREALEEALGTEVGGVSPDGSVRLVGVDCGGESTGGPLVTLDGQPQPRMNADSARAMATSIRARAATTLSPQTVLRIVTESGLRGRGGAGYPTGDKWRDCASRDADVRYVVANGFEADPGAQLDRTLMERDPHAIVEGVALAAYAVGASRAFICVRAGRTTALRRLDAAVRAAEAAGLLGTDALGTGFNVDVEVLEIPGGMVVGEETVLLRAIENRRAQPEQRPPYPSQRGLWDRPTVVNNVETLALVPWIVANGAAAFRDVGDRLNPGTTLVQATGAVGRPGIAEVKVGTAIGALIEQVFGGVRRGRVKAVLVGGPGGGFLPPAELGALLDPGALVERGAIWGSGTLVVADDSTCLVDMATLLERHLSDESCGKTIPCRIGVRRLYEIGWRATHGLSRPTDPQLLLDLASDVRDGALCGLEYCAPNPLLSGMRYFAQEFEDHFVRGACPAGVCTPQRVTAGAPSRLPA